MYRCSSLPIVLWLVGSGLLWNGDKRSRAADLPQGSVAASSRTAFLPTAALIVDPTVATLVQELAQSPRLESAAIGMSGSPSAIYPKFARIVQAVTRQQAVALLRHESPVVRGYLAQHVAAKLVDALDALYPLLGDAAEVEIRFGCRGGQMRVSDIAVEALREQAERPSVQSLLLRAAQDPQLGANRAALLHIVARHRPDAAATLARNWLRETDPTLLIGAIETLQMVADEGSAPAVCALARSTDDEVRIAVIRALPSMNHPCAEPTLRKMTEDRENLVRERAVDTYVRIRQRDFVVMQRLLADPAHRIRSRVAAALAQRANPVDLSLLRTYLVAEPDSEPVVSELKKKNTPEVTTFLRQLCAQPSTTSGRGRALFCEAAKGPQSGRTSSLHDAGR